MDGWEKMFLDYALILFSLFCYRRFDNSLHQETQVNRRFTEEAGTDVSCCRELIQSQPNLEERIVVDKHNVLENKP